MITTILLWLLAFVAANFAAYFGVMAFVRFSISTFDKEKVPKASHDEFLKKVLSLAQIAKIPVVNVVFGVFLFVIWILSLLHTEIETNRGVLKQLEERTKT
jgi:uncharacterized membrane protein